MSEKVLSQSQNMLNGIWKGSVRKADQEKGEGAKMREEERREGRIGRKGVGTIINHITTETFNSQGMHIKLTRNTS